MSSKIPGFAINREVMAEQAAEFLRNFNALLAPGENALGAQAQERLDPIKLMRLFLDDVKATPATGNTMPRIIEINIPHAQIFAHDSNSQSAYFYYRPFSRDDNPQQWIKMIKGKQYNLPFPCKKAFIWYPSQDLLTMDILFSKFGQLQSPEVVNNVLATTTGSSTVTAFMGAAGTDTVTAVDDSTGVVLVPAEITRAKSHFFNDGGDIWIGDSNVDVNRGLKILAGERFTHSNLGPLYVISDTGATSNIYGMEERQ